jgi:hypothetical protein
VGYIKCFITCRRIVTENNGPNPFLYNIHVTDLRPKTTADKSSRLVADLVLHISMCWRRWADLRVLVACGVGGGVGGQEKVGVPLLLFQPFHYFQEYFITVPFFIYRGLIVTLA